MSWRVLAGDCLEQLRELDADSIDAIVTDPPYGLEFMGKDWDRPWAVSADNGVGYEGRDELRLPSHRDNRNANCRKCGGRQRGSKRCQCAKPQWDRDPAEDMRAFQIWIEAWATELLRVLKPGGHLVAFGGTRTYHRLASGVEDAGFEVRDQMMWLYGSGFPKSLDVSKAIDKAAGAERETSGATTTVCEFLNRGEECRGHGDANGRYGETVHALPTSPATPEAERWNGWGTALKPAHEPIVVARKPLAGTVAENVLRFGTGALNIDGSRIGVAPGDEPSAGHRTATFGTQDTVSGGDGSGGWQASDGRWPANVVLDEEAGRLLDEQSGEQRDGVAVQRNLPDSGSQSGPVPFKPPTQRGLDVGYGGSGGASRFFYCAKASKGERNAGLDGFEERRAGSISGGGGLNSTGDHAFARNSHPTVKPIELMRYLVRLVTPTGGTVLDPFLGSGTTGCAAVLEGFDFIGIEREPEYVAICEARIAWWEKHRGEGLTDEVLKAAGVRDEVEQSGQLGLLEEAA